MGNPLFENRNRNQGPVPGQNQGGIFGAIYNRMYQSNPQFRDLANSVNSQGIDEVCAQHGIDPNQVKNMKPSDMVNFLMQNGAM